MFDQNLFVIGLAKSGTTYLANIIGSHPEVRMDSELLNQSIAQAIGGKPLAPLLDEYQRALAAHFKTKEHLRYSGDKILFGLWLERVGYEKFPFLYELFFGKAGKVITIVRDPRDMLVSERFHVRNRLVGLQESPEARWLFGEEWKPPTNWILWWQNFLPNLTSNGAMNIIYRDLYQRPEETAQKVFDWIGLETSTELIAQSIETANNPKKIKWGRFPFRKGEPGQWLTKLRPDDCIPIKEEFNDILFEYSWESETNWEYKMLDRFKELFVRLKLGNSFPSVRSHEFWQWLQENRTQHPEVSAWFEESEDYDYPLMRAEMHHLRSSELSLKEQEREAKRLLQMKLNS